MFKVVPIWEFCILVYSMVLLKSCQIFVLHSLVFLFVCSSLILLGFSFILFKKSHFLGIKRFNSSSKIFAWGKCVFFWFCIKIQYFQYLCKSSIFLQIFNICINPQYLCKFSIFTYLYLCIYLFSSLWSVYEQIYLASGVRERDYCFGSCPICVKIFNFHNCMHISYFCYPLSVLCTSRFI